MIDDPRFKAVAITTVFIVVVVVMLALASGTKAQEQPRDGKFGVSTTFPYGPHKNYCQELGKLNRTLPRGWDFFVVAERVSVPIEIMRVMDNWLNIQEACLTAIIIADIEGKDNKVKSLINSVTNIQDRAEEE